MPEEKMGANWEPEAAEEPLKREGLVPKTKDDEVAAVVAGAVGAVGAEEEREPGEVAAEEEDSVAMGHLVSDTKLNRLTLVPLH